MCYLFTVQAPTGLNKRSQCNSVEFSWNLASCGDRGGNITSFSYLLYDGDGFLVDSGDTDATFIEIDDLMYGETYEFNVAASTSAGQGPVSGTNVTTESGTSLLF